MKSRNFEFLRENHRELADLGGFAETYVHSDPGSCLVKLRTFAEFLVKALFSHHRLELTYQSNLNDLLADHSFKSITPPVVQDKLHLIRIKGNHAAHGTLHPTTPAETAVLLNQAQQAASALDFSEEETRFKLIDELLAKAGWTVGARGQNTDEVTQEHPACISRSPAAKAAPIMSSGIPTTAFTRGCREQENR